LALSNVDLSKIGMLWFSNSCQAPSRNEYKCWYCTSLQYPWVL